MRLRRDAVMQARRLLRTRTRAGVALVVTLLWTSTGGAAAVADRPVDTGTVPSRGHVDAASLDASEFAEHVANVTFDTPWPEGDAHATDSDFVTVDVRPGDVPRAGAAAPAGVHWYREDMAAASYRQRVARTPRRVFNVMGAYLHGLQIIDITDRHQPIRIAAYD